MSTENNRTFNTDIRPLLVSFIAKFEKGDVRFCLLTLYRLIIQLIDSINKKQPVDLPFHKNHNFAHSFQLFFLTWGGKQDSPSVNTRDPASPAVSPLSVHFSKQPKPLWFWIHRLPHFCLFIAYEQWRLFRRGNI